MGLKLRALHTGSVEVKGTVNGAEVLRKELPGLGVRTGKVAVGCRNLQCRFSHLVVRGKPMPKPKPVTASPSN
jgi:serine/threonine-protein kinase